MATSKTNKTYTFQWVVFIHAFLLFILMSIASPLFADDDEKKDVLSPALKIEKAEYDREKHRLTVTIKVKGLKRYTARLFDNSTNQLLLTRSTEDDSLKFKISDIRGAEVPCTIKVQVESLSATRNVIHAPSNCDGGVTPSAPTPPTNQTPTCSITEPATNPVSIQLGESVSFQGTASDPENSPLTYEWEFNGGADVRPAVLNPGAVVFDVKQGTFLVHFFVTDNKGARCDNTVTVIVGTPDGTNTTPVPQQPAPGNSAAGDGNHTVLPFNDLGMHCADLGSYPLSILPPFNDVNAHAIQKGTTGANKPRILNDTGIELRYSAASNPNDPVGSDSINSTSQNFPVGATAGQAQIRKSDFWDDFQNTGNTIAALLFPGLNPLPDEGLQTIDNPDHGRFMPGIANPYSANDPQSFGLYLNDKKWFTSQGIPMTPVDDKGRFNSYPLLRVQMVDKNTGNVLATSDVVTPVSTEVDCRDCHTINLVGADPAARQGANAPQYFDPATADRADVEIAAKKNILALHDFKHGTDFITVDEPVLCASCHRSNALATVGGPQGDTSLDNMSRVMHGFHGRLQTDGKGGLLRVAQGDAKGEPILSDPQNLAGSDPLIPFGPNIPMEQNCFLCHPGKITQCFRGAMYTAGQECADCHGDLLAVGGEYLLPSGLPREPWVDEPKCGSCHTGIGSDPVRKLNYDPNDPAAAPLPAKTQRFAENSNTLYRESHDGHAGIGCESCHGSPHAIWPNRNDNANDNVTAIQLQGHKGTITECTTCHEANSFPNGTLDGPHGMHPVNDPNWIKDHEDFAKGRGNGDSCAVCHGADHRGTRLAKTSVDRVLRDREGKVQATLKAGDIVSCDLCHSLNKSFDN